MRAIYENIDDTKIYATLEELYENLRLAYHDDPERIIYRLDYDSYYGFVLDCKVLRIEYKISYKNAAPHGFSTMDKLAIEIKHNLSFKEIEDMWKTQEILES
jgi:hypothetical protein